MRKYLIILLSLVLSIQVYSQEKPVQIVFDVTSADPLVHEATMRHVSEMSKNYQDSKFQVVLYGGSVNMVVSEKSSVLKEIKSLASNKNVGFAICEQTMKRRNITADQLIPGVIIVPDGILEIILKQQQGWGYIKESN
ncbi:DsrE family protein [Algoriphagus sp.]|uniref:DsrE family protein n=1 Tax=Algoriphagus sp. TaxID=1872435 RepID=UPI0027237097|nr:DsrE family protein [Algoriphagus sp.]MDO8966868.1 DsrE family protein [Algoriphagus sp.]MDP3199809.1 DsrE family protein [Algoriphagus sp.]